MFQIRSQLPNAGDDNQSCHILTVLLIESIGYGFRIITSYYKCIDFYIAPSVLIARTSDFENKKPHCVFRIHRSFESIIHFDHSNRSYIFGYDISVFSPPGTCGSFQSRGSEAKAKETLNDVKFSKTACTSRFH